MASGSSIQKETAYSADNDGTAKIIRKTYKFELNDSKLMVYSYGEYYELGKIEIFRYSVKKVKKDR